MLRTLQWLIEHNFYYSNVTIDHSVLALLRIDGDLTILPTMSITSDHLEEAPAREDEEPYSSHLGSTFVPLPVRGQTEQQAIQQSVSQQNRSSTPTVSCLHQV